MSPFFIGFIISLLFLSPAHATSDPPLTAHSSYGRIVIKHGGLVWTSNRVLGRNVLVIHSYHEGDKKTDDLMQGIYTGFNKSGERIQFSIEYMDTKRFPYQHHLDNLKQVYKYKYTNKRFDVIIISGNEALNFLLGNRSEIFYGTPIVFSGIMDIDNELLKNHEGITGVVESVDPVSTIELALTLHPDTSEVVVLSPGKRRSKTITDLKEKFADLVLISHWNEMYFSDIEEKIGTLRTNTILLPLSEPRTKDGANVPYDSFVERIAKLSHAPVYSLWDTAIGSGAIGGFVVNANAGGQTAGQLALDIIHGKDAAKLPLIRDTSNRYMFDYLQLQHFNIKVDDLPQDSLVINKPFSIYEIYYREINLAILLLLIQTGIIFMLFLANKRRKLAETALKTANDELENNIVQRTMQISDANSQLLKEITERKQAEESLHEINLALSNAMPGISKLDADGRYIMTNNLYAEMLGYRPEELIGESWEPTVHPDDRPPALAAYQQMLNKGKAEFEARAVRKDGTSFYKQVLMVKRTDESGEFIGHHCFMRDITERRNSEDMLQQSRQRLLNLTSKLHAVREEERKKLAQDIHDELGQTLTGLRIDLGRMLNRLPRRLPKWSVDFMQKLRSALLLIDETQESIRQLVHDLRPVMLDDLGLVAAIEWQVEEFMRRTGYICELNLNVGEIEIDNDRDIVIFRILQEALTNIARHANADHVKVSFHKADSQLVLKIIDNGIGIKKQFELSNNSIGLIGMQERANMLGGKVRIGTVKEGGTQVVLTMPIDVELA